MTPKTKACFARAVNDEGFINKLKEDEPSFRVPGFFGSDIQKTIIASTYYGYIIGKDGRYYDKEDKS